MTESASDALRRYVRFGPSDERSLQAFQPLAERHFDRIVGELYAQVAEHDETARVFTNNEHLAGHQRSLRDWLDRLLSGPWDTEYYAQRQRIGQAHVQVGLPQRFMFSAMTLVRIALSDVAHKECRETEREELLRALHKLLDIELAIMLESYSEAFVERVQREERLERDDLRQRLALSEARYEEIVEKADALICTFDQDGTIRLLNGKSAALSGGPRESAYGTSWLELFVLQQDHPLVRTRLAQALTGQGPVSYEGPVPTAGPSQPRVRWHFTTLPPQGSRPTLCAIGIDVSHEHELGVRIRRAERLASLGTMAAGLAHEIRNPLNAAHLQLSMAERRLQRGESDDATMHAVSAAASEMERLRALVHDFLQFAKPRALSLQRVSLRPLVEATLQKVRSEAEQSRMTVRVVPGDDVAVEADRERIEQLLLHLVRNAFEAAAGGTVEISVAARGLDAELIVEDDGPGLPPNAPVFEPFYTTKEHGTGLGLAIVHRIVMDHGGQVEVQSAPGSTRFTVSLPCSDAA